MSATIEVIAIPHRAPAQVWHVTQANIDAVNAGSYESDDTAGLHDLNNWILRSDAKGYKGHQQSRVHALA